MFLKGYISNITFVFIYHLCYALSSFEYFDFMERWSILVDEFDDSLYYWFGEALHRFALVLFIISG